MKTYKLRFWGRKNGAIGVTDWHVVTVRAGSEVAAKQRLYDTHDHIMWVTVLEVSK